MRIHDCSIGTTLLESMQIVETVRTNPDCRDEFQNEKSEKESALYYIRNEKSDLLQR